MHSLENCTILGIESSCDETAAAVYSSSDGVRSNVLVSQIDLHKAYGGVVPEIASRAHINAILPIIQQSLEHACCSIKDIDAIAVTNKPGLPGSLLIGVATAKAIAYAQAKKLVAVNHLEAHIFSAHIDHAIPFPYLCLTASGGHTALYRVDDFGAYNCIGHTRDDAAGEAFDKTAKLLGLGYPGGAVIEQLARATNFTDFFKYPRSKDTSLDLSFSGLKTAVLYDMVKRGWYDLESKKNLLHLHSAEEQENIKKQVASSLLVCMGDILVQKVERAFTRSSEFNALTFVGGVSANQYLRDRLTAAAHTHHKAFFTPTRAYCTDNAAMVAFVGHYRAQKGLFADFDLDVY